VRALTKHFGKKTALDCATLEVADGERCVVLGASGAGKTTLLRLIAGLERQDSGSIAISGREVSGHAAPERATALVFSDGGLFPHLCVYENLAFALRLKRVRNADVRRQVGEIAQLLGIEPHLFRKVSVLSGGERQRVALGRALLRRCKLLLLDEPLAHLDPLLRDAVRASMLESLRTRKCAALYVTHDHEDAFSIADRVAILIDGRLVQCGDPQNVYDFPASVEVAAFVGSVPMNLFDYGAQIVGIRAENVELVDENPDVSGVVLERSFTGASWMLSVDTPRGLARVRVTGSKKPVCGARVGLRLPSSRIRRFDKQSGLAL